MKKAYIIALLFAIGGVVLLTTASKDMSTYATFADAEASESKFRVVGTLALDKEMVYNPEVDPNYFSFFVNDSEGSQRKVILKEAKPQDFEMSEQIVMSGAMNDGVFMADQVLVKCPSKYKDEEVYIRAES